MKKKYFYPVFALFPLVFLFSCDNEPLLTELCTNRIKVVLKGTYESTNPSAWSISETSAESWVQSVTGAALPNTMFLDISELRINGDEFAKYRSVKTFALSDSEDFFNGNGVVLKNDDVYNDRTYSEIELYIRKMGFNAGYNCTTSWVASSPTTFFFNKGNVEGYDFNLKMIRPYGVSIDDDDDDDDTPNIVFPVHIPIGGNLVYDSEGSWVLEVRLVVKNNIARYTTVDPEDSTSRISYWALDDKIVAVSGDNLIDDDNDRGDADNYIGGNIAAIAWAYKEGNTGTITATATASQFLVAIPSTDDISTYISGKIPPIVARGNGGATTLQNVPAGKTYNVYRVSDDLSTLLDSTLDFNGSTLLGTAVISGAGSAVNL